jgi:hypothetical protein
MITEFLPAHEYGIVINAGEQVTAFASFLFIYMASWRFAAP